MFSNVPAAVTGAFLLGIVVGFLVHNLVVKRATADIVKAQADLRATLARIEQALGLDNKIAAASTAAAAAKPSSTATP